MTWTAPRIAGLALAALALHLALVQPNHPDAMTPGALAVFPLELPVILLGLIALRPGTEWALVTRVLVVALLVAMNKCAHQRNGQLNLVELAANQALLPEVYCPVP